MDSLSGVKVLVDLILAINSEHEFLKYIRRLSIKGPTSFTVKSSKYPFVPV